MGERWVDIGSLSSEASGTAQTVYLESTAIGGGIGGASPTLGIAHTVCASDTTVPKWTSVYQLNQSKTESPRFPAKEERVPRSPSIP